MTDAFFRLTPDHILDSVERALALQDSEQRPTGRVLALNSIENRVYEIALEDGSSLIAKFYRPGRWSVAQILEEHHFLLALEKQEVPAVAPLGLECSPKNFAEFNETRTLALSDEDILFTIFPKRPGRSLDELNEEQLSVLGRYIARIHNVGRTLEFPSRKTLNVKSYGRDPLQELINSGWLASTTGARYIQLVQSICDRIEPLFVGLKMTPLHGDCHLGNVLWNWDLPHFVDFDDMLIGPPVQDIWMISLGRDKHAQQARARLLEAYGEFRDFDYDSLRLIEPLRALRIIHYSAWIARRWQDPSFPRMFPQFGTESWWQEEIEALNQVWESLDTGWVIA